MRLFPFLDELLRALQCFLTAITITVRPIARRRRGGTDTRRLASRFMQGENFTEPETYFKKDYMSTAKGYSTAESSKLRLVRERNGKLYLHDL
jgi:hypothetical protein